MTYQCPKGHQSTDSDYCSECGTLIGQSNISKIEQVQDSNLGKSAGSTELCPDCGTSRALDARFCEVCRHDFEENKTGVAEAIMASQLQVKPSDSYENVSPQVNNDAEMTDAEALKTAEEYAVAEKLNVVISVDKAKAASSGVDSPMKPDSVDRVFPLDLNENLVGRRSVSKGIYPEIMINDPGVSHRHFMFIKQPDSSFAALELGSSNGTELNGVTLEPGVNTPVKAGDEFNIGIWTKLKLVSR
jgi:hypothetical protein